MIAPHPAFGGIKGRKVRALQGRVPRNTRALKVHPEGTESATEKRPPLIPPLAGSKGKGEKVV